MAPNQEEHTRVELDQRCKEILESVLDDLGGIYLTVRKSFWLMPPAKKKELEESIDEAMQRVKGLLQKE